MVAVFSCHFLLLNEIDMEDFYHLRVVAVSLFQGGSFDNTTWCQPTSISPSSFLIKPRYLSAWQCAHLKLITSLDSVAC